MNISELKTNTFMICHIIYDLRSQYLKKSPWVYHLCFFLIQINPLDLCRTVHDKLSDPHCTICNGLCYLLIKLQTFPFQQPKYYWVQVVVPTEPSSLVTPQLVSHSTALLVTFYRRPHSLFSLWWRMGFIRYSQSLILEEFFTFCV